MGKDTVSKGSFCKYNGHNSKTCATEEKVEFKLFGVDIFADNKRREDLMMKSASMGNIQVQNSNHDDDGDADGDDNMDRGYLSDSHVRSKKDGNERKKGVPWTMEEHKTFLRGLEKLGKGDWRGISKNFVTTRTSTQVASHAQKYFQRKAADNKKKRRASLFDVALPEVETSETNPLPSKETHNSFKKIPNQVASQDMPTPKSVSMTRSLSTMPMSSTSIPNFSGIPYMFGTGASMGSMKSGGYPSLSFFPVVNICNVGYPYQPKHNFTAFTTFATHQLYKNRISASDVPHCIPKVEPQVNTDLKMSNTPLDSGERVKLQTHTSNMIGAIGVI